VGWEQFNEPIHGMSGNAREHIAEPGERLDCMPLADEEYVRELIDRIDEMSLRGVKVCDQCTEEPPGKWQGKLRKAQCDEHDRNVERHFVLQWLRLWRGGGQLRSKRVL
jgi:hypothetical protein